MGPGSPSWRNKRFGSSHLSDLGGNKDYHKDELLLENAGTKPKNFYKRRKSLITKVRLVLVVSYLRLLVEHSVQFMLC
jgi:hypothetical protein